jgi:hypothetical protein
MFKILFLLDYGSIELLSLASQILNMYPELVLKGDVLPDIFL